MFKTRLLSGILLVLIALVTIIGGGDILLTTILMISIIGMSELYKISDIHLKSLGCFGYVAAIAYYALIRLGKSDLITLFIIVFLIAILTIYVLEYPKYRFEQIMLAFFGLLYVAVMLSYVYQTRMLEQGVFLVWLIFICSWGCDTSAYCVGMLIGKHKMAPKLSPKKSVEGGIGGILGAALLGAIYAVVINYFAPEVHADVSAYAIVCGVGGMISQVGDLAASAIKRNHDIKDYGTLIPGHGGILDRFDSVIITAPIIYYMALILM